MTPGITSPSREARKRPLRRLATWLANPPMLSCRTQQALERDERMERRGEAERGTEVDRRGQGEEGRVGRERSRAVKYPWHP